MTLARDDIFARLDTRLAPAVPPDALDLATLPPHGDHVINPGWAIAPDFLASARVAAILIGLVDRPDGVTAILTRRTGDLRAHAGQIAFPGGKMDPEDATPADTALREAFEEIGLDPARVDVRGYLGAYLTGSGYRIVPVVARLAPPLALTLNPAEVDEAFEVPIAHLMNAARFELRHREWRGARRAFYEIQSGERTIWGITAGIIRVLYERLYT